MNIPVDPIDEALKLVYLQDNRFDDTNDISLELNRIVECSYSIEMSSDKKTQMVNSLYVRFAVDSLGVLITKSLENEKINVDEASTESNLPVATIEQLQSDSILANSIPIVSFRTLLKKLQIPFDKAEQAIIKTFNILKNDVAFSPSALNSSHLAYRSRYSKEVAGTSSKTSKSDSQLLFKNEEALNKYLDRLRELYN